MAAPDPFVAYLRAQSEWREGKAAEYPEDSRNQRSASSLRALADYVENLSEPHPAVLAIESMHDYGTDLIGPSEDGARMISHFGFDREESDFDAFLDEFAAVEAQAVTEEEGETS